ncbi:MAG: peptidase U32 family protein [Salinivirgaceae bacterium]
MHKPELLLPVGKPESFYAAMQGGANAVYLGLKDFNARNRAANFTESQLLQLIDEAHKQNVKVYLTLNTVIKNAELPALAELLWFLSNTRIDAVIIQDWGTFYLLREFFPRLTVHASTQMGNHNSAGAEYSRQLGFKRVILARELTLAELTGIQQNTTIETEVFVHGALCYSFSGMCLFSSYLGGAGANRGMCAQPCRRFYNDADDKKLIFSLKDNELIDYLPDIMALGVHSLKVEGRLKSAEYVYRVARAYRLLIDFPDRLQEAKELLAMDMGRDKTAWFFADKLGDSITTHPGTGIPLGSIQSVDKKQLTLTTNHELKAGYRLRVRTQNDSEALSFTVDTIVSQSKGLVTLRPAVPGLKPGMELMLVGTQNHRFPSKLKATQAIAPIPIPAPLKESIQKQLNTPGSKQPASLFLRIADKDWLPFINFQYIDHLLIQPSKRDLETWTEWLPEQLRQHQDKIWFELPQFITEKQLVFYRNILKQLSEAGFTRFVLSHLSQKLLLPANSKFATNENVYAYNDAAVNLLLAEGSQWLCSPFENDMENLIQGKSRQQVLPLYFYPKLFYSRQPVSLSETAFSDDKNRYRRVVRNGITHILPLVPVALTQYRNKLENLGFNRFLIDLSFEEPSKTTLKRVFGKLKKSEAIQPSTGFNFKKGLK